MDTFTFDSYTKVILYGQAISKDQLNEVLDYIKDVNNHNSYTYYYLLRIVGIMLEYDPKCIKEIPDYFLDEQFIKKCYTECNECLPYIRPLYRELYLSTNPISSIFRKVVKLWRVLKASV